MRPGNQDQNISTWLYHIYVSIACVIGQAVFALSYDQASDLHSVKYKEEWIMTAVSANNSVIKW